MYYHDQYITLGDQVMREMSTSVIGDFDYSSLVNAAAGVAATGIKQKQDSDAANKLKKDSDAAISRSLNADQEWANAEANLELAATDPTASAASRVMRDTAKATAMAAGAALQGDGINKRCKAAHDALQSTATASNASPKDIAKAAKFHAWQKVSDGCGSPLSDDGGHALSKLHDGGGESWLTAKHAGLPTYGWALIGVGGLTAFILIMRSMKKK